MNTKHILFLHLIWLALHGVSHPTRLWIRGDAGMAGTERNQLNERYEHNENNRCNAVTADAPDGDG